MPADSSAIPARSHTVRPPTVRRKLFDGRTRIAKRMAQLERQFASELAGDISDHQRSTITRAARLTALAEDAQSRRMGGDMTITLQDLVRLDNSARRAVADLGLPTKRDTPPPAPQVDLRAVRSMISEGANG